MHDHDGDDGIPGGLEASKPTKDYLTGYARPFWRTTSSARIRMTSTVDNRLDQWLFEAHTMEHQSAKILSQMADQSEVDPELQARVSRHAEETQHQAALLATCLKRRGADLSRLKDGKFQGVGSLLSDVMLGADIVKAVMACYTFEYMETAAYRVIITASEEANDLETSRICRLILWDEQAMASWLAEHIQQTTARYLQRTADVIS